jgi:gliding motility-associated-like protein
MLFYKIKHMFENINQLWVCKRRKKKTKYFVANTCKLPTPTTTQLYIFGATKHIAQIMFMPKLNLYMKKNIFSVSLFTLFFISAKAQNVTLPGPVPCNGAAVTGTFTVPCTVTSITVEVYGGGGGAGGGGGGSNGGLFNTRGGGGAGGGGYSTISINVVPGSSFTYSIGTGGCGGGNGGDGNDGNDGTSGASSTFTGTAAGGTLVSLTANGGIRGTGGDGTGGGTGSGGAGGAASGGTTNATGTAGNNGSGGSGGAGGASAGPAGGTYGGGGAGGGNSAGGRGAAGGILITYNTTIALPITPTISSTPATCLAAGSSTISNYDPGTAYTFTPAGPTAGAGGLISGMVTATSYTVVAGTGACASSPSSSFSNAAVAAPPAVPTISSIPPTCTATGISTISNYSASLTYVFTPSNPTVGAGGVINGMVTGLGYTVEASDGTCSSGSSASFSNAAQLLTPAAPTVTATPPTCTVAGSSTISNYNASLTYIFSPTGPTTGAGGAISGMINGTIYTVEASDGTCSSNPSAAFSNAAATAPPDVPTISSTAPSCAADGSSTISNYNAAVTYVFTPAGPSAGAGGAISGMVIGTSYTVEASDGTCSSAPSNSFSNGAQLTVPVAVVTGQLSYCTGSNTTLTASGGASYIWADAGANIIGATASVTVTQGSYAVLVSNANGCRDTAFATVTEISTLPVTISGQLIYCPGSNTTITANGGTSYVWNDTGNSTTASITVTLGTYNVTGTDANGCTGTASANVTASAAPSITIIGTLSYCTGANITLTANGGTGYVWNDAGNSTTASITVTQGNYTVTGTDANGCTATANAAVTENAAPAVTISGLLVYCSGGNTTLTANGGANYVWNDAGNSTTASITVTQGTYNVTATDANGCTGTNSAVVTESSSLSVSITGVLSYCAGANTTLTATGGTNYVWNDASINSTITATQGTYSVTATDATCSGTASAVVTENAIIPINLGNDVTACQDSTVVIDAGSAFVSYTWSGGETTQTISPLVSGAYSVTAIGANSCTASDAVNVLFDPCIVPVVPQNELYIPTAFSPNGDGANDLFRIRASGVIKKFTIRIFNRWGEQVFESNDINESWDGFYKGVAQPLSSYGWSAEYTFSDGSKYTKSGNVTLVR